MDNPGRAIVVVGLVVVALGVVVMIGGRLGLGKLPGDINIKRGNTHVFIPITTCIVVSVVLTVVVRVFFRR